MDLQQTIQNLELELDLDLIKQDYSKLLPIYNCLENEGKHILNEAIKAKGVKIHHITSRVKESDSFIDKIERKRYKNPFEETTDIVGLRVVCLFLSDIDKIEEIILNNFNVITVDNKIKDTSNPNTFDYMSAHYIVKIKDEYVGFRYDSIKNKLFEIQVRTVSMDAWANISHFLEYKNENDIPSELKRDFNALSGLFYVADTHFEMFYNQSLSNMDIVNSKVSDIIEHKTIHEVKTQINLASLNAYINKKFPDRKEASSESISSLVTELISNGYHYIETLDSKLENYPNVLTDYEKFIRSDELIGTDRLSKSLRKANFNRVGAIRVILALIDIDFRHNSASAVIHHYDNFIMSQYNTSNLQ